MEKMLRLVRLTYPNSVRGDLFTEFATETAHDSIKYIKPVYNTVKDNMSDKLDGAFESGAYADNPVTYESSESRYASELVNAAVSSSGTTLTATFATPYIDGYSYITYDGKVVATEMFDGKNVQWVVSAPADIFSDFGVVLTNNVATITYTAASSATVDNSKFAVVGRKDSDGDLKGEYLGEVDLQVHDYIFKPRPIALGVKWTQLSELVLDTSFGVDAEEMLMDSASQEIKKSLDYQAIKQAVVAQKMDVKAKDNTVEFNAQPVQATSAGIQDSYWHTAQTINQAVAQVGDKIYNAIKRGGVSAIVGGPKAVTYLMLCEGWTDKGKQPAIGAYKAGELNGIPVFKAPADVIGSDDSLFTVWKNPQAEMDVALAIGTLMPFFSTGVLQRRNFYKEAGLARYEDSKVLNANYFGRIDIKNIRG